MVFCAKGGEGLIIHTISQARRSVGLEWNTTDLFDFFCRDPQQEWIKVSSMRP